MRVFIVEDDNELREVYEDMLKGTGWQVVVASNALGISPSKDDVVVLDLNGTHSRLMSMPSTCKMLTISGTSRLPVDLQKPFSKEELVTAIKKKAAA